MHIERYQTIFARLSDMPDMFACLTYGFLPATALSADWDKHLDAGPNYSVVATGAPEHASLPMLTDHQAQSAALNAYHSGADLPITARVFAERSEEAAHDYCDTQNVYSMPGAHSVPEEELNGSARAAPTIEQEAAA